MKKKSFVTAVFTAALMSLSLVACGGNTGPSASLEVNETSITVGVKDTYQIKYKVTPSDSEVIFSDYDTSLISVSDTGLIKGLAVGNTNVKISIKDTTIAKTIPVKIENSVHPVDIDVDDPPEIEGEGIYIHYYRKDGKYTGWNLWLWEGGHDGAQFDFNGKDNWGVIAAYPLTTWENPTLNQLGFIIRKGEWESKDVDADRFVDFSLYEKDENGIYHIYLKMQDSNIYIDDEGNMRGKIEMATFANMKKIAIRTNLKMLTYSLKVDGTEVYKENNAGKVTYANFALPNGESVDFLKEYVVDVTVENGDQLSATVSKMGLYQTEEFGNLFNYDGELGAIYTSQKTTFRVWSPFSTSITLNVYNTGTPAALGGSDTPVLTVDMVKGEKGVFSVEVDGDLAGKYYTYVVNNASFKNKEIVDPYAKSCGVNGVRGMIVNFAITNPAGWDEIDYLPYDRKELTIYETHVADVTSSETWTGTEANRKLFKGMYESGTTYTKDGKTVSTGFDHIKELGVNAVQIIPFFDQANDEVNMTFNWGYNPLNYNALEGGYSSDPYNGYARIREFKELVKEYNKAGIEIIMDVVYNHVAGAAGSNFDVLLPGYYYRYTAAGTLSNGSGCGNETASENYMMRKFMIDSVKFWAKEYKLGGFRFDLMGLHDLDTMEMLTAEAKKINEHITIFGEPWTGGTSPLPEAKSAKQINGNKYVGYGAFNDQMRDALIKGGLSAATDVGWIANTQSSIGVQDLNKLVAGIQGATLGSVNIPDPNKTVNYVTCHDNYTLYDRIIATKKFTDSDKETIAKMNVLANSIVFTSQGTSFMLAGEEFLRTKGGDHNSYMSSYKVNELDYALKIEHLDMFETYKQLISLKQKNKGLHLEQAGASSIGVSYSTNYSCFDYRITDGNTQYIIIHANGLETTKSFDLSGYSLYWSTLHGKDRTLGAQIIPEAFETIIAYK